MQINRHQLQTALNLVTAGLSKLNSSEQMQHFIFTGENVVTYNDFICVSHPFKTDFKHSVNSDDLLKILNKISSETIEINLEDTTLIVKTAKTKAKLVSNVEDTISELISELESQVQDEWSALPEDFIEGAYLCMFSASKDMTLGTLTCLNITGNKMYSCDNVRMSSYEMSGEMEDILIQASCISELKKIGVTQYSVSESWLHFLSDDGVRISIRRLKGSYMELEEMFHVEGAKIKLPEDLTSCIETASVMSEGDSLIDKSVSISIDAGFLTVKASKTRGSVEKKTEINYKRTPIFFRTNPIFFVEILKHVTAMTVGENAIMLRSGKFRHVLAIAKI